MRSLGKTLLFNASWSSLANVFAILVGIVTIPAYVRFLGIENYGFYVLLGALVGPLALLQINLGQATAIYIARSHATDDIPQLQRYVSNGLLFSVIIGLIGSTGLLLATQFFNHSVFGISPDRLPLAKKCICFVAAIWLINQPTDLFMNIAYSLQKFKAHSAMKSAQMIVMSLAGLAVAYHTRDILGLFQAQLLISAVFCGLWHMIAKNMLPRIRFNIGFDRTTFRHTIRFGFWQTLTQAFGLIQGCGDKLIIGYMLSVVELGYYNIARNIVDYLYMLLFSGIRVLAPFISQQDALGRQDRHDRLIGFGSWITACLTTSCYLTFFLLGDDLLRIWINPSAATEASGVLRWLLAAIAISSLSFVPGEFAIGKARPELLTAMAIFKGLAVLAIAPVAIGYVRLNGAGIAILMGSLATIPYLYQIWRSFFRNTLSLRQYCAPFFIPVVVGTVCVLALAWCIRSFDLHPQRLATLVPALIATNAVLLTAIIGICGAIPSCRDWVRDFFGLLAGARRHLARQFTP